MSFSPSSTLLLCERSYMVEKNRKLHNQFNADASSASHSGTNSGDRIFEGVSIFVDGFTIPSSQVVYPIILS